ncbi:MAG: hypothetical protein QOG12_1076 [Verrucomicrobiota bacterium]
MKIICYVLTASFVLAASPFGQAQLPMPAVQADALLRNQALTPAFAADPERQPVMRAVRLLAQNGDLRARLALLKIADPEIVQTCLTEMRSQHWSQSADAASQLGASGQPRLIVLLSEDLLVEESAAPSTFVSGNEHVRIRPRSVLAAKAIRDIILNAPEFSEPLKSWARQLDTGTDRNFERGREAIKSWWKQNERLLRDDKYQGVQAPQS